MITVYKIYESAKKEIYVGRVLSFRGGFFLIEWEESLLREDMKAQDLGECFERLNEVLTKYFIVRVS